MTYFLTVFKSLELKWYSLSQHWLCVFSISCSVLTETCMHAQLRQSCPTLCDSMDCSLLGSSVHEILQARILEWVAMPSSRGSSWPMVQPNFLTSTELAGRFFTTSTTWEAQIKLVIYLNVWLIWQDFKETPSQVVLVVKNPPANAEDIRD